MSVADHIGKERPGNRAPGCWESKMVKIVKIVKAMQPLVDDLGDSDVGEAWWSVRLRRKAAPSSWLF
jgi:hypothetical protein